MSNRTDNIEYAANEAIYGMQMDTLSAIRFVKRNAGATDREAEQAVLALVKPYVPVGALYKQRDHA